MDETRKRRRSRWVEKYLLNAPLRLALWVGLAPSTFALLETTGNRSGLSRQTPVGNGLDDDTFWLVAEHGRACDYVRNVLADPHVRVKTKRGWSTGVATPLPDDDGLARRRRIDETHGLSGRFDGKIFEKTATDPLTIRIDLDPPA